MMRFVLCAAIAGLSAVGAAAAPVYIENPDNGQGVVYYGTNNGGPRAIWWGGQRTVKVSDSPDFNPFEELEVFCVEPYGPFPHDQPLEYMHATLDEFGLNAIQQNRLQLLVDNAYPIFIDNLHPYDFAVGATAFQVLIWEIFNDGATANPLNLTTGLTRVDVLPADDDEIHDMFDLASDWVTQLNSGAWSTTGLYQLQLLVSDEWQDLAFIVEVPEPSSVILAGMALLGIVAFRRRARAR